MRPPICRLCDRKFTPGEGGELLSFRRSEAEADREADHVTPGMTGHPPHKEWFCTDHVSEAREYTNLTLADALEQLRSSE